jgi:hypothetical protein
MRTRTSKLGMKRLTGFSQLKMFFEKEMLLRRQLFFARDALRDISRIAGGKPEFAVIKQIALSDLAWMGAEDDLFGRIVDPRKRPE